MEKVKSLVMFAVKVYVAILIGNLIINLLPEGIRNTVRAAQGNPLGTVKSFTA